jgi:hypothetical protein
MCPLVLDGRDSLWEFGLQEFSSACSHNPPKCHISEVLDLPPCVLLFWMDFERFTSGDLGFRSFLLLSCAIL